MAETGTIARYTPSFAARRKRGLKESQKRLMNEVLPTIEVRHDDVAALSALLAGYKRVALEIGFGKGEHLCHRAQHDPDTLYIGCEVFDDGIAACVRDIDALGLTNARVFIRDARLLLDALPADSLDMAYILFPDPWPKTKHRKRRIVNQETLDLLARVLKTGGTLQLGTDHQDYLDWMCAQLNERDDYTFTAMQSTNWTQPPTGHITTRYQHKAKAGEPYFLALQYTN